jgi:hypothetical protein
MTETEGATSVRISSSMAGFAEDILLTMKKCLARANDPGSTEAEVKVALQFARRLMARHNVTQAEVLAHEDSEQRTNYAGQSVVRLVRIDKDVSKRVLQAHYLVDLCVAMNQFFDCKCYTDSKDAGLEVCFYGIAESAVAAATAFVMVYNLTMEWSRPYKGVVGKGSYCAGVYEQLIEMAKEEKRNEAIAAKKREEDEVAAKIAQEEVERQAQLDRLAGLPEDDLSADLPSTGARDEPISASDRPHDSEDCSHSDLYANSDADDQYSEFSGFSDDEYLEETETAMQPDFQDDDDYDVEMSINCPDDVNERISAYAATRFMNVSPSSSSEPADVLGSGDPLDRRDGLPNPQQGPHDNGMNTTHAARHDSASPTAGDEPIWSSHKQLMLFRHQAAEIADEYIKGQGKKLYKGRKRRAVMLDSEAFDDGARDSKRIDVHKQSIADKPFSNAQVSGLEPDEAEIKSEEEEEDEDPYIKTEED